MTIEQETKRAAFEAWAQDGGKFGCDRDEAGDYVEAETQQAWAEFLAKDEE